MTYLDKLTELQNTIGYVEGSVHPVAMLGLMGECGEVANECEIVSQNDLSWRQRLNLGSNSVNFCDAAAAIDELKKEIRKVENIDVKVVPNDEFNTELSDLFYYLNAVAIGRGLTIEDLARMGYEKVIAKRGEVKAGDPVR